MRTLLAGANRAVRAELPRWQSVASYLAGVQPVLDMRDVVYLARRMRDRTRAAALAAALLLTSACSGQPQPQLIDDAGLVTDYQFHATRDDSVAFDHREIEAAGTGAIAVEPPAGWDIRVVWPAGSCQQAPTVQVIGTPEQVRAIHVDYGPEVGRGECPAELLIFGVDLKTSRPPAPDLAVTGA
jgi:hypothetical protein